MSNFWQRFLVVILLGGGILAGLWFSSEFFLLLFMGIGLLSIFEYDQLVLPGREVDEDLPQKVVQLLSLFGIYAISYLVAKMRVDAAWLLTFPVLLLLPFVAELFNRSSAPFTAVAFRTLGLVYVGMSLFSLPFLVHWPEYDPKMMISSLLMIWMFDTGGYVFGKLLGRHKAVPSLSPGKTWEGYAGGLLTVVALCYGLWVWNDRESLVYWIGLGLVAAVFSAFGDLIESMLKRQLGVKDSGKLIPGHGGMLDRFDAFFIAIPFMTLFVVLQELIAI